MKGKELSKFGKEIMQTAGWWFGSMNSRRPTPTGMIGFPDHICFKDGMTMLVEVKGDTDKLRPEQKKFRDFIVENLSPHLMYRVVKEIDDWIKIANYKPEDANNIYYWLDEELK